MSSNENKALLLNAIQHFNNPASRESYFDLYAPHAVLHRSPSMPPGLNHIKAFYRAYWTAFPDIRLTVTVILGEADMVACAFEARATHQGTFLNHAATGREVTYAGVTILRFEDSKCVERWSQTDMLSLLRQIGAAPAP
jgi:predicted ester cyclase